MEAMKFLEIMRTRGVYELIVSRFRFYSNRVRVIRTLPIFHLGTNQTYHKMFNADQNTIILNRK